MYLSMYVSKYIYRPQRSFLHVCVILSTGGGICLIACWDTRSRHPPRTRSRHPTLVRHPPEVRGRHPPDQEQTHPSPDQEQTATAAAGTHPTGVCSFCWNFSELQILWSLCSVDFHTFNIAIAYSNSTFCGAWTPSFCEFTQNFSKTSTPLECILVFHQFTIDFFSNFD